VDLLPKKRGGEDFPSREGKRESVFFGSGFHNPWATGSGKRASLRYIHSLSENPYGVHERPGEFLSKLWRKK
jgi:hypothetical protein